MKKIWKIVLIAFAVIVVAITSLIGYVKTALPNIAEAQDLKIEYTAERIARGEYLATSVSMCMDCHSTRDYSKFAAPTIPGTEGKGGELFGRTMGFPGNFYAPNITPAGIGNWTDGELFRALTTGVSKDGHALFPVMPYPNFGQMDKEDIYSIIAYIRTLKPIENNVPASEADFPVSILINTMPQEANLKALPEQKELIAYGKYMANASGCTECHTPMDKGKRIMDKFMAGGFEFPLPDGTLVRSVNLTPDKQTGIGHWTEQQFVSRFKMYADPSYVPQTVGAGDFKTVMPWNDYSRMKEDDLKAIFAYLKSIPAINNSVVRFEVSEKESE